MTDAVRIPICVAISVIAHLILADGLKTKKKRPPDRRDVVTVRVVAPPEPEPPPEPPKAEPPKPEPPPEPPVHELTPPPPKPRPTTRTTTEPPPAEPPPPTEKPAVTGPTTDKPVFGVTMESTSTRGAGPTVPVGNTVQAKPDSAARPPADVKPLPPPPVAAHEVSKAPIPKGRCSGTYTEAARQAGLEGVVVLDLVVGADGRARDIKVVSGLDHGLTEAAVTALEKCTFTPGEKGGAAVAVRVRGFKIRFFLRDGD